MSALDEGATETFLDSSTVSMGEGGILDVLADLDEAKLQLTILFPSSIKVLQKYVLKMTIVSTPSVLNGLSQRFNSVVLKKF